MFKRPRLIWTAFVTAVIVAVAAGVFVLGRPGKAAPLPSDAVLLRLLGQPFYDGQVAGHRPLPLIVFEDTIQCVEILSGVPHPKHPPEPGYRDQITTKCREDLKNKLDDLDRNPDGTLTDDIFENQELPARLTVIRDAVKAKVAADNQAYWDKQIEDAKNNVRFMAAHIDGWADEAQTLCQEWQSLKERYLKKPNSKYANEIQIEIYDENIRMPGLCESGAVDIIRGGIQYRIDSIHEGKFSLHSLQGADETPEKMDERFSDLKAKIRILQDQIK